MTVSAEARAAPLLPQRRVPDFFIVGHHKSGTTALYEMLRRHPQIFMPALKEPRFFAADLRAQFAPSGESGLPLTMDDYLALFAEARPDQLAGEASPSYLRSHSAARAIAEVQPGARIIAILREPASFVRSMHLQLVQEHVEQEKDLRRAFEREQITRAGQSVLRYSDHVRYVEQLRRYHAAFPANQVLVLIYDDFRADNRATMRTVLRFLDVEDNVELEALDANPSVRVRSLRLDALVRSLYAGRGPLARCSRSLITALTPARARRRLSGPLRRTLVYAPPKPPEQELMLELRRRFQPEVRALSEYLGRDLVALWGYDQLD